MLYPCHIIWIAEIPLAIFGWWWRAWEWAEWRTAGEWAGGRRERAPPLKHPRGHKTMANAPTIHQLLPLLEEYWKCTHTHKCYQAFSYRFFKLISFNIYYLSCYYHVFVTQKLVTPYSSPVSWTQSLILLYAKVLTASIFLHYFVLCIYIYLLRTLKPCTVNKIFEFN